MRERRLYPGAGTPAEEVAQNQRERLFGAIVALVSEQGYEATTVADVLALSGVSRSAFYEHFANKAECLTAAAAELVEPTLAALEPVVENGDSREARDVFEAFFALLVSQPAAARVCFVELHAVGEEGEALGDRGAEALAATVEALDGGQPGDRKMDPKLVRALIAGLRKQIHTRLARGEEAELEGLAPELWQWLTSVVPPPGPLVVPRRQRTAAATFEGYTPGERIARAVAAVVTEKGYGAMSTDDIAAQASISLSTFYAHFEDKRDAVLGALEMSGAQIMALAVPAARRTGSWDEGVRALYEAVCHYFAAEPAMAAAGAGRCLRRRAAGARSPGPGNRLAGGDAGARFRRAPRGAGAQRGGRRGDGLRADARAGAAPGARERRHRGAACDLHHPGPVRRSGAGPGGGKRRGRLEALGSGSVLSLRQH